MLYCFRTGGANNSEIFVTAIAAVLARYPDQVIYDVTDPRSGLPAQLTWMPTIKDVYDACERALLPIRTTLECEKRIVEQLAARKAEDEKLRPTLEQLQEKYGKDWGLTPHEPRSDKPAFKAPTKEELSAHYREYGLEFRPKAESEIGQTK